MIGNTISHYKITGKLGEGGMGVVYKAEDTKLKRTVALKFLPAEFSSDAKAKARFLHEAQAVAALEHPNICTIHEIDETDNGRLFIVMDCYMGETLKEKVACGPLPMLEALNLVSQVAGGLSEAHSAGMVHRDIKPANIMVTDKGVVKILDFGLAKLSGRTRMTKEGTTLGTVAYMSPDQTSGEELDERSDIFSLGVVLYELLTGEPPFKGDHDAAIIYSIINLEPESPKQIRDEITTEIEEIVLKAIEKDPGRRYRLADELRADLRLAEMAIESGFEGRAEKQNPSIAVLPFANMSPDPDQDYFCDGMAEDIVNNLSKIADLHVASRTSSFAFKGKRLDVRDIGKHLGVDTVLEGGVQKAGDRLRITVQLINVSDGYQKWSERFDRDLDDIFAIQDEIGRKIVESLKVRLTDREKEVLEKVPTTDVEAYDFYIRGRQSFHRLGAKPLRRARNLFMSAIIRDSEYGLAYCGLADCYSMLFMYFICDKTHVENAVTASKKALELDNELAEAHASHGLALSLDKRYEEADQFFRKATQLSPRLFEAYYYWARTYWARGDLEKAAELFQKADSVRQEDYQAILLAANAYRGLNRQSDLEAACLCGLKTVEALLQYEPDDVRAWQLGAQAHVGLGNPEKALEWIRHAMSLDPDDPATSYNAACVFGELGMQDEFFDCFERAIENGYAHREWIENDPYLRGACEDPRFSMILKKL